MIVISSKNAIYGNGTGILSINSSNTGNVGSGVDTTGDEIHFIAIDFNSNVENLIVKSKYLL